MVSQSEILDSLEYVVRNSTFATIDKCAIENYVHNFVPTAVQHWSKAYPLGYQTQENSKDEIDFLFLIGLQAFCYWAKPGELKSTIRYKDMDLDGWWAMIACFQRAQELGLPVLEGEFLSRLTLEQTRELFKGNVDIPLLVERRDLFNKVGETLVEKYRGRFYHYFESAPKDAFDLVVDIAQKFSGFDDVAEYKGRRIYFYKKAQLVVNDLASVLGDKSGITNIDRLIGCADYKIPAMLRKLGVLNYSPILAEKVDNRLGIDERSEAEVEIRANQLWAVHEIARKLKSAYSEITPGVVQDILWIQSQDKSQLDKPYHLTRTIYY